MGAAQDPTTLAANLSQTSLMKSSGTDLRITFDPTFRNINLLLGGSSRDVGEEGEVE